MLENIVIHHRLHISLCITINERKLEVMHHEKINASPMPQIILTQWPNINSHLACPPPLPILAWSTARSAIVIISLPSQGGTGDLLGSKNIYLFERRLGMRCAFFQTTSDALKRKVPGTNRLGSRNAIYKSHSASKGGRAELSILISVSKWCTTSKYVMHYR